MSRNPAKDKQKYQPIFLLIFSLQSFKIVSTEKLNLSWQELDVTDIAVSFVVTWWIFTPVSELLSSLVSYTAVQRV